LIKQWRNYWPPTSLGNHALVWAAPIIIVKKKDKTPRMCVDYRALNKITKVISLPLPLINDLLALVGKAK
jgi:hypothetical protein